jgi:transcriptional regulator with XRE-family HTH domain
MVLLRRELGDVLREKRQGQGRTLREVSSEAACSLGYLSEVERGEKEASSELLASICRALDVPLSEMLSDVADRVNLAEAAETQMTAVLHEGLAQPIRTAAVAGRRREVVSAA